MWYHDIVFNGWLAMDESRKMEVLAKHFQSYKKVMTGVSELLKGGNLAE
jgi:hypothetical protein